MPYDVDPSPCPECGHPVYRPLLAPVHHAQQSCRAVLTDAEAHRCGCSHTVHRMPTSKPRHRQDVSVAS